MAELALDVLEQILVGLEVKDLTRCKSVCKSWQSFISGPRFVKAHLNHPYNNDFVLMNYDHWRSTNDMHMVGSCNGLLCVFSSDIEFVVTNPSTRQEKRLPRPPHMNRCTMIMQVECWGFGYDSSTDDYKVIAGFMQSRDKNDMLFYALTLKSNTWKVIGEIKWDFDMFSSGILCNGALHWFSYNNKQVIISLDLSTEQFKEIPVPPPDMLDIYDDFCKLGVIEDWLCMYSYHSHLTRKKWVMKNNKWELYNDRYESKYYVAHHLTTVGCVVDSQKKTSYVYSHDDGTCVPINAAYICTGIFVKSLVPPHPYVNNSNCDGQKRMAKLREEGNERAEAVPRATQEIGRGIR